MSTLISLNEPREGIPDITHKDIDSAIDALSRGHGPFSVDTERAMGIRYSDRAYLVQIRREGAGTFLIDPIGIEDHFPALADVMSEETWILHAADQDLPSLRELGLEPPALYDTEMAGLLLGFERISLQAEIADVLGYSLAKEHSFSDWSQRPITPPLRAYAALDVELLLELANKLTHMLDDAGRLQWLREECEEIRLRPPKETDPEPWRKVARSESVTDRRALGMLQALWHARDDLARKRDVNPSKVLPSKILAQLAKNKPRSFNDVSRSSFLRSRTRQRDAKKYWNAIAPVWAMPTQSLPARRAKNAKDVPFQHSSNASRQETVERWELVRTVVLERASELKIRHNILLKPSVQKHLASQGWVYADDIPGILAELGARPWQIENTAPHIVRAAHEARL